MITIDDFTRQNNDVNGNPRYAIHFFKLLTEHEKKESYDDPCNRINSLYDIAIKRAKKIGGRKYHCKKYGGGIIFQSYNLNETIESINKIKGGIK